jgi:hypothetical protein
MDIGTILKGVGIAKEFLGGGSSGGNKETFADRYAERNSRLRRIEKYSMGTDSSGNRPTTEMAPPGQASQIQQVSYKDTQRFWDNFLTEYMK